MVGPPELEAKLRAAWPPDAWRDVTVVLAVSGGADSTALLRAAARLKAGGCGRLVVGHFNHGIRPSGEEDERFVAAVCESLDIPFEIRRGDVAASAANEGDGIESAARRARYEFLAAVAEQHGARLVATAHTADDQAETILHHIVRGTGLTGLSGMPRSRPLSPAVSLLRPMLSIRRAEVV
ncbi:MAG: tRNA lysidine(34) synthetase TilS, partial [Pirellulales bacterium]